LRFPTSSHINNSAILTGSVDGDDDDDENDGGNGDNVGEGKEGDF
jgi:hypothetical protein